MNKLLSSMAIAVALMVAAPVAAEAAPYHHIHYVMWHGHRGYWDGVRFVMVEPAPAPVIVPAYYPQPYPAPAYYAPVPVYYQPAAVSFGVHIR